MQKSAWIENTFGYALHHCSYLFKNALRERLKTAGFDITPEDFVLLSLVQGDVSQKNLVQKSLKDKASITRTIDKLVQKRYLIRKIDPQNRRQQLLNLSQNGKDLQMQLQPIVQDFMQKAFQDIPPDQLEVGRKVLWKILGNLGA